MAGHGRAVLGGPVAYANRLPAGAAVFTLDSTDIMASVGGSLAAVLQARVPGLSVLRSGGNAADGARVQLRGPHSMYITTDPIVIVDGIRVNAMQESSIIDVGVRTSRLDDIAPEDVARVDVLPGPAAATLFGPGAAGGALLITTKRGAAGLHWSGRAESRLGMKPSEFPANYHRQGTATATGQPATNCDLLAVAAGACTPTRLDVWNPLEQASPFRATRTAAGNLSLSGGVRQTTGRVSASGQRMLGLTGDDDNGRLALRASVAQRVGDALEIGVYAADTRTSAGLPLSGGSFGGIITSGLIGAAVDDANHGFALPYTASRLRQRATHWLAGGTATWRPTSWLSTTAIYGRDELDQREVRGIPITGTPSTFDQRTALVHDMTTSGITSSAMYDVGEGGSIRGQTTIGYDRLGSVLDGVDSLPGAYTRTHHEWVFSGPWIRQQVSWRERLVAGIGVRRQNRKAFGDIKPPSVTFKAADVAWSLGDVGRVRAVRLRAAYGEGGVWMAGNPALLSQPGTIFFADPSFADPVERTAESELGVEASWGDLASMALTAFRSDGSKLYVAGAPPPSSGAPPGVVTTPAGRMRNDGLEVNARARLIDRGAVRWDAALTAGLLRNRVRSLGGYPPIIGAISRIVPGRPVAGYWTRPYTYADANRDGIIDTTEVAFGDTAVFSGTPLPTREVGLGSSLSLPGHLTAGVLLDYHGGQKLANDNERLRCLVYRNCRGAQDPSASLEDQARVAAIRKAGFLVYPFVHDASFLKLRALSLTWRAPWARAAITLAGRNLATWTRYPGLDPELDQRRFDQLTRVELGKTPIVREIVLRLDLGDWGRH